MDDLDIDRLIAEAEEYLSDHAAPDLAAPGKHAINHDVFDEMTWESALHKTDSLVAMVKRITDDFPLTGPALEDFFNLFYKTDPRMVDIAEMLKDYRLNHVLVDALFDSNEVARLREHTLLNEYASTLALEEMEDTIREVLEEMKGMLDALQALQMALQQALQNLAQALQDAKDAQGGEGEGAAAVALSSAQEAADEAQQAVDQAQQELEQQAEDAKDKLQVAASKTADRLDEDAKNARTYGLEPADTRRMTYQERKALSRRLRGDKMRAISRLLGNFKSVAKAARRRRVKRVPAENYDYVLGDDLTRLVPEEMNNLAVPELEDVFWLRWAQHGLLTHQVRGPERSGQGPIIVVCDESSSMDDSIDEDGNTKEMWSKAFALTLCEQAKKEQRDFTYVGFCVDVVAEYHFPRGRAPLEKVIDFVEHFGYGGTRFEPALERALELIEESERRREDKPDILFLTDGDGSATESFLKTWHQTLKRLDAHCYAIQLGGVKPNPTLSKITDDVMLINQFNANPEGITELFTHI